jgi:hypothetical protein
MKVLRRLLFLLYSSFASALLVSCLATPETPDTSPFAPTISILLLQEGHEDSTELKVSPHSEFSLKAQVTPAADKKHLTFFWMEGDSVLGKKSTFAVDSNTIIPSLLRVTDAEDNTLEISFEVVQNTPPELEKQTIPSANDTLYGNVHTAFSFAWTSVDPDKGEICSHYLEIDSTVYSTGILQSVQQSGFAPGKHKFRVWVVDSFGDADTLAFRSFTVLDTTGGT